MKTFEYDIVIVGGGASGLFLAERLSSLPFKTLLVEKKKSLARKFVVAGKGGLNISSNLAKSEFIKMYEPNCDLFKYCLEILPKEKLIRWYKSNGGVILSGSNNKLILEKPKAFQFIKNVEAKIEKKIDVLKNHKLHNFDENKLKIINEKSITTISYKFLILALGGASWKCTGSDGSWNEILIKKNIRINEFQPSNCEVIVELSNKFYEQNEGKHIKNVELSYKDKKVRGELFITKRGIIGGPVYHLVKDIKKDLTEKNVEIGLDFKPDITAAKLIKVLKGKNNKVSWSNFFKRKMKLPEFMFGLLKFENKNTDFNNYKTLAGLIKCFPLKVCGLGDIEKAISTSGGIDLSEVNNEFSLKKYPNVYAVGEMLDWDAPTGGFLLQGCMSQAEVVFQTLSKKLERL